MVGVEGRDGGEGDVGESDVVGVGLESGGGLCEG